MTQQEHHQQPKKGFSRRDFLRLGSAAGGVVLIGIIPGFEKVSAQDGPEDVTPRLTEITVLASSPFPPPTPREDNTYWQEIEKRLGVRINFQFVPSADYITVLGTTLASGDLPDCLNGNTASPVVRQAMLDGAFVKLGDFGLPDDVRGLPGMSTLPLSSWRNSAFNGVVYGVPTAAHDYDDGSFFRTDWMESLGIEKPTTLEELTAMVEAFAKNDPDGNGDANTIAFSLGADRHADGGGWRPFTDPFGIPNIWQVKDDGTLEHKDVSEQTRAAVAYMRDLFALGIFNPDFLQLNPTQANEEFATGISGGLAHNLASGYDLWGARVRELIEGADVVPVDPVTVEGFTPATWLRPDYNTVTQIRFDYADDEELLWELLKVIDFWFDDSTRDFVNFGFVNVHHTVGEDGAMTQTEKGSADIAWIRAWSPRHYLKYVDAPYVSPANKLKIQEDTERLKQWAIANPVWGLYPELGFEDPTTALDEFANGVLGRMVTGEQSLDEWDDFVADWYSRGGQLLTDTMTAIYQANME